MHDEAPVKVPVVTKDPAPPQPTPPATPFPTPTPAVSYSPETTKKPGPFIDSVAGIPIFDARTIVATSEMGNDGIMAKKLVMIKEVDAKNLISFDVPGKIDPSKFKEFKGTKAFITYPDMIPRALVEGTRYMIVNQNIANALGLSDGGMMVPLNKYGDMFSPEPYDPTERKENMTVSAYDNSKIYMAIYVLFAILVMMILFGLYKKIR